MRLTRDERRLLWRTRTLRGPNAPPLKPMSRKQRQVARKLLRAGLITPTGEARDDYAPTPLGAQILRQMKVALK